MKKKLSKAASLLLSLMLVLTLIPSVDTGTAFAADGGTTATTLYIKDTTGEGDSQTVTDTTTDSDGGWAWDADTATLTLEGFHGEYIASTGALNIVLKGANTITMPSVLT